MSISAESLGWKSYCGTAPRIYIAQALYLGQLSWLKIAGEAHAVSGAWLLMEFKGDIRLLSSYRKSSHQLFLNSFSKHPLESGATCCERLIATITCAHAPTYCFYFEERSVRGPRIKGGARLPSHEMREFSFSFAFGGMPV